MAGTIARAAWRLHYLALNRRAEAGGLDAGQAPRTRRAPTKQQEFAMSYTQPNTFLRYALLADAIASGATGLLLITGTGVLESLLNIPVALSREAGLVLIPYVAFVAYVGTR